MAKKILLTAMLLLGSTLTYAVPILHLEYDGDTATLMGVSGLTAHWLDEHHTLNLQFKPGTFEEAYGVARDDFVNDPSLYPDGHIWGDYLNGVLYQFLIEGPGTEYSTNPNFNINGCVGYICRIHTPFKMDVPPDSHFYDVELAAKTNAHRASDEIGLPYNIDSEFPTGGGPWDPKIDNRSTWAVWSLSDARVSVPEPSSLLLILSAIPAWLFKRCRYKKARVASV